MRGSIAMLAAGLGLCWGVIAAAEAPAPSPTPHPGAALYRRYCGACHGLTGKGNGVVSGFLRPRPPDLTQLARKAGGRFPFARVLRIVDGRETIRAHGESDMPVWGEVFRKEAASPWTARLEARGKLLLIVSYLESIQEH